MSHHFTPDTLIHATHPTLPPTPPIPPHLTLNHLPPPLNHTHTHTHQFAPRTPLLTPLTLPYYLTSPPHTTQQVWQKLSPTMYLSFWSLSLYDISVPTDRYETELKRLRDRSKAILMSPPPSGTGTYVTVHVHCRALCFLMVFFVFFSYCTV